MFYRAAYILVCNLFSLLFRISVSGRENIPQGAAIVCVNHTASSDPIFAAKGMTRRHQLFFMAKAELMRNPLARWVLRHLGVFAVERGKADMSAVKHALELLKENKKVAMFPEGTRVSADESADAKTGAVMLALRGQVPFLPVYVTPGHKKLFSKVKVIIGQPYRVETEGKRMNAEQYRVVAEELMERIRALGGQMRHA